MALESFRQWEGAAGMLDVMAEKRLRVSFDAETEAVRRAVYIAAAMQGKSHNELLNSLIKEHLAEYLTLAKRAIAQGEPAPRNPREK